MSNTAITRIQTVDDLGQLGQIFVKSGFFADTRDAAQAIVKVMAGQELGFAPIASMTGVYIVKGKVSLSANLMAAAIKRSGRYTFKVAKLDAKECAIEFFEIFGGKRESIGVSSFTIAEAAQAGLAGSSTWKNFPRNMLYARAMSNGAKWYCPDVFGGPIYTPDELGATVDGETGEMIDVTPSAVAVPTPTPTLAPAPKNAPRAISAAPAPVVGQSGFTQKQLRSVIDTVGAALGETSSSIDTEDIGAPISLLAQTVEIIDSLAGYGVEDALILKGIKKMTGQTLTDLSDDSIALLSPEELKMLIQRYGQRLAEIQSERADQPDREAFDESAEAADDAEGPRF